MIIRYLTPDVVDHLAVLLRGLNITTPDDGLLGSTPQL